MDIHTVDQIFELNEELRRTRGRLARYDELLVALQRSILPQQLPAVRGLDLAVHFAEADGVSGDFYDVQPSGPDQWAIVVADVSGHGLAAAAVMALVHALGAASRRDTPPPTPGAALSTLNRALATRYLANTEQYVTAFVGWYDARRQMLTYASAGHLPPRLVRAGQVHHLDAAGGMPLGIDAASVYEDADARLLPGDRLILFTDGMTEAVDAEHEPFGDARFDAALAAPATTATQLLSGVLDALRAFRGDTFARDDETCLVGVVQPLPDDAPVGTEPGN